MTVISALQTEHRLFDELLGRMERAFQFTEAIAREEIRDCALILLPALDKHERIEDLVFGDMPSKRSNGSLKKVENQHREVEGIKKRLEQALEGAGAISMSELREMVATLIDRLRIHFETEERWLWPKHEARLKAAALASLGRRATKQVNALQTQVEHYRETISDYL